MKQFNLLLQIVAAILAIIISLLALRSALNGEDIFEELNDWRRDTIEDSSFQRAPVENNRIQRPSDTASVNESEETANTFVIPADMDDCADVRFRRRDEVSLTPEQLNRARVEILRQYCRNGELQQTQGTFTEPPPGNRILRWQARQRRRT